MKSIQTYIYIFIVSFCLTGCFKIENQYTGLAPGPWRATLDLSELAGAPKVAELEEEDYNYEDTKANHLPFNFEVIYTNETDFHIEVINGEERIKVTDIAIGRDKRTNRDTFLIDFPVYDSYLKGIYMGRVMQGEWVLKNRANYRLPFVAQFGKGYRFTQLKEPPTIDLTGKWKVEFEDASGPYPGIGEFVQQGNKVTGTFLTETGDYRFLEGTIQKDRLHLSVFDGAHAFLFEAKLIEGNRLIGIFKSGKHYQATWSAEKDEQATLTDPNELTYMRDGQTLSFAFENEAGKVISLEDEAYKNKVKLVQIFGTWCPNCRDETTFLVDYFKKYPTDDIAIIGLAFEKHKDPNRAKQKLRTYKQRMNIPYELLLAAGSSDKAEASQVLPMLNKVISYPTLLFLNRENEVVKIHTGFSGPATSKYEGFVADFEKTITELVGGK